MFKPLLFAMSLLSAAVASADASPSRIVAGEYPPYASETMAHDGPISRIITRASQKAEFADAIATSLQNGLESIRKQGLVDGFLGNLAQTDQ